MKNIYLILFGFFILVSCEKESEVIPHASNPVVCDKKNEATVRINYISEDLTEWFYFLELTELNQSVNAYPTTLPEEYKKEGKLIYIEYRNSSSAHSYVNCGNPGDVTSPNLQFMPVIDVCKATAVL